MTCMIDDTEIGTDNRTDEMGSWFPGGTIVSDLCLDSDADEDR